MKSPIPFSLVFCEYRCMHVLFYSCRNCEADRQLGHAGVFFGAVYSKMWEASAAVPGGENFDWRDKYIPHSNFV